MRKENSTNSLNNNSLEEFCEAHKVLNQLSGRWKISILFALSKNELSYTALKTILLNITDRILSKQLSELNSDKIINNNKTKLKSIYSLTEKGEKLMRILSLFKKIN